MHLDELFAIAPLWFVRSAVVLFGLLWGSFLNVVIYRMPREMSVVRPASHCPGCGAPVAAYDNLPVLSYLLLRGRARCCAARMSPRYPLVELIGGAVSLAVFEVLVLELPGSATIAHAAAIYVAHFALCLGLVAAAFIDAEHMYLPDAITLGGTALGIATATLRGLDFGDALLGATIGFAGVYVPFIFLYKGLLGRTGMGLGDAKLLALAGAWFGWPGALFALLAGSVQGSLYAGVTRLLGIEQKLPDAVLEEIAELERAAAAGDEEAKLALAEDPLTEDEDDAFIVRFFQRLFGRGGDLERGGATAAGSGSHEAPSPEGAPVADGAPAAEDAEAVYRARIPFGPFLILAMFELLFAGQWLAERLSPLFAL